jgi:uncharacterized protein
MHGVSMADDPASMTELQLERLEHLLAEEPYRSTAMSADALQGLFVAIAMGPDATPPARWLDAALGDDPEAPRLTASAELVDLMTHMRDDTARRVQDGTLALLLYTLRRGRADYATWSRGFLTGVELSDAGWYDAADPEEVEELLFPLVVLADELTEAERARYTAAAWRKLVLESEAGLETTLARLRDYWAIVRSPPRTVRFDAPRAGRNDPCPCGSGRKHKHCCGR